MDNCLLKFIKTRKFKIIKFSTLLSNSTVVSRDSDVFWQTPLYKKREKNIYVSAKFDSLYMSQSKY